MKAKQTLGSVVIAGVLALVVTGCTTTQPKLTAVPQPVTIPVRIDLPAEQIPVFTLTDRDDAAEVVRFGISLSDSGRHAEAAEVFLDAASRFISKDRRLEQALIQAAIKERWLAGDLDGVRNGFSRLDKVKQRDIYDRAGEDAAIRKIRELVANN